LINMSAMWPARSKPCRSRKAAGSASAAVGEMTTTASTKSASSAYLMGVLLTTPPSMHGPVAASGAAGANAPGKEADASAAANTPSRPASLSKSRAEKRSTRS
jgi:hypothetical protein